MPKFTNKKANDKEKNLIKLDNVKETLFSNILRND